MSYLMRVQLDDRPGSLGLLAVQLGSVGADIRSLEVVERGDGYAVDDIVVDLPPGSLPDTLITAAEQVKGVLVDSLRPHAGVLDTHLELELIDLVAGARKKERLQVLVDNAPRVLRASWALIVSQPAGDILRLYGSSGAPETPLTKASWLPLPRAQVLDAESKELPKPWREMDTRLAAAPILGSKALLLGRVGGPDFRPSEVARLGYLTGIISTVIRP